MEAIIERCAGLDVHQATVVACVLIGEADRKPHEIRTFSTMARDLEAMRDWLKGVTHVGMESTGIYWRPVHTILEGHFELIVANAHHMGVPRDWGSGSHSRFAATIGFEELSEVPGPKPTPSASPTVKRPGRS